MKDTNAIYDFKNGDYIINQMKQLLEKTISKLISKKLRREAVIELKNSHADVFSLIIFDSLNIDEIQKIKNLIYEKVINHKFKLLGNSNLINIDITIGCSKSNDDMLQIYAEKALHNAKLNYMNYMYCDSYLYKNESVNEHMINILNYNIENNLVEPYFHAIMCNKTDKIIKYEALMRIFDQEGNIILPHVFIHKAKKSRLYNSLLEIFIDKITNYIVKYKKSVNINLDYTDLLSPSIKRSLISKIKKNNIGEYLTIEILESEKISNFNIINDFISELKKYDVKIAIDDFGTGFSNYEYILSLNVDFIKIDGSLIKKIDEDIYKNLIISIVQFCKQQNIEIVAEFVSDLNKLRYVKALGIDYSQGFYIAKPIPIEEILEEINDEKSTQSYY
jgi:EAL domain-containing protein (putative c-di-GMP-specific phosphodiesterase class I)